MSLWRYNLKCPTFRRRRWNVSNLGCLNLPYVCAQKILAYIFNFHCFLGGGQSPSRDQVSCAWQLGTQCCMEKALPFTSPNATCFPTSPPPTQHYRSGEQTEPGQEPRLWKSPNGARHFCKMFSPCTIIWIMHHYPTRVSPLWTTISIVKNPLTPLFYMQYFRKKIIFLTYFLSSTRYDFFLLPWIDNFKVLVNIGSECPLEKHTTFFSLNCHPCYASNRRFPAPWISVNWKWWNHNISCGVNLRRRMTSLSDEKMIYFNRSELHITSCMEEHFWQWSDLTLHSVLQIQDVWNPWFGRLKQKLR